LRVKSATSGAAFTSTFTISNDINLLVAGRFKLSFYTFIHCANLACNTTSDRITVKLQEDGENNYKDIFTTGFENGRIRDDKWVNDEIDFITKTNKIKVQNLILVKIKWI
jgi:hypothetical protein